MDWNSGVGRNQATRKDGTTREKSVWSKLSSKWVNKDIKEKKTKTYIKDIISEIETPSLGDIRVNKKLEQIPQNIAPTENPGREEIVKSKYSRFHTSDL